MTHDKTIIIVMLCTPPHIKKIDFITVMDIWSYGIIHMPIAEQDVKIDLEMQPMIIEQETYIQTPNMTSDQKIMAKNCIFILIVLLFIFNIFLFIKS